MSLIESLEWRYATKKFAPKRKVSQEDLATIQTHLGAATNCGACTEHAQQVIDEALAQRLSHAV